MSLISYCDAVCPIEVNFKFLCFALYWLYYRNDGFSDIFTHIIQVGFNGPGAMTVLASNSNEITLMDMGKLAVTNFCCIGENAVPALKCFENCLKIAVIEVAFEIGC